MKYILVMLAMVLVLSTIGCVSNNTLVEAEKIANEAGYNRGYGEGKQDGYDTGYQVGWKAYKEELSKPEGSIVKEQIINMSYSGASYQTWKFKFTIENVGGEGAITTGLDVYFTDENNTKQVYHPNLKLFFKTGQQREVELSFSIPASSEWSYSKWCRVDLPE